MILFLVTSLQLVFIAIRHLPISCIYKAFYFYCIIIIQQLTVICFMITGISLFQFFLIPTDKFQIKLNNVTHIYL